MGQTAWNDSMATGYERIDEQHRELVHLVDELNRLQDVTEKELLRALDRTVMATIRHFHVEEDLMTEVGYPVRSAERMLNQHADFAARVQLHVVGYHTGVIATLDSLREYIGDFLANSEFGVDKLLADWIVRRGSVDATPSRA